MPLTSMTLNMPARIYSPYSLLPIPVKYRVNPVKLGKAPTSLILALFACLEFDDSTPYFEEIKRYMHPQTEEERWAELEERVRASFANMKARQEAAFDKRFNRISAKLKRLANEADHLITND